MNRRQFIQNTALTASTGVLAPRPFAWANTIFGELVLKTFNERPQLLN